MNAPMLTRIFRIIDIENLKFILLRGGIYAPNSFPKDDSTYRCIHNQEIQSKRFAHEIPCGVGGVVHDYVAFYFGARSPMLLQLKTGQVKGYSRGQEHIIYLVSTLNLIKQAKVNFVFSDGHGIAKYTQWYDNLNDLNKVDWNAVNAKYWRDTPDDNDRQRRKQAEFLIHKYCDWNLIESIGVHNKKIRLEVENILADFPTSFLRPVILRSDWYYD